MHMVNCIHIVRGYSRRRCSGYATELPFDCLYLRGLHKKVDEQYVRESFRTFNVKFLHDFQTTPVGRLGAILQTFPCG